MKRNIEYLPEDLLVEILSRVPEASLARLRSTSNGWNALIKKEERLAKKSLVVMLIHRRVYLVRLDLHGDNIVKVISQLRLTDPLSSSSKEVDIRRVCHCDGETSRIIKPLDSKYSSDTYALGKSSCNNEYKILRVYHRRHGWMSACLVQYEIYDFTSNSWRLVERFGCVSLPVDPASYNLFALSVTREEQKLCLFTSRVEMFDIIEIWMATKIKSTGDMSWSNLLTVKRTHPLFNWMSFLADRENKVIVYPTKDKNSSTCLHFVGTDEYIRVDHHDVGSESSLPGRCDPTLVQIQRGSLGLGTWKAPMT
ncbi:hypothetical protein F2Q69_00030902 [Brassica cretica]|uniref:F-box domain-containing protein n=1 Tax=Brassica cretica TaxID=69181 RepID=A0A8S9RZM3_BRACR|nr:hypothetical protein F2Q69_00030902 [Brassica cretica]